MVGVAWGRRIWVGVMLGAIAGCAQVTSSPTNLANPSTTGEMPVTSSPTVSGAKLKVVATILPMYWFTKAVAGEQAAVSLLIPPGSEVHEYQSRPADVQAIAQANVLVENGLGLESFLQGTIDSANHPQLKIIQAAQGIEAIADPGKVVKPDSHADHGDPDQGGEHGHDPAAGNPHVWLDPVLAKKQVTAIRDGLIAADPAHKDIYTQNAAAYLQQLDNLDQQFRQGLQKSQGCTFVAFHDAYPYLARRYQLQQVAVVQVPEDHLSPSDVSQAIAAVRQFKAKALFGEPGVQNSLLKSLSQDLQLTLRPLDSLEAGDLNPQHYFTAMQDNLQQLQAACQ